MVLHRWLNGLGPLEPQLYYFKVQIQRLRHSQSVSLAPIVSLRQTLQPSCWSVTAPQWRATILALLLSQTPKQPCAYFLRPIVP